LLVILKSHSVWVSIFDPRTTSHFVIARIIHCVNAGVVLDFATGMLFRVIEPTLLSIPRPQGALQIGQVTGIIAIVYVVHTFWSSGLTVEFTRLFGVLAA
jgi:hypothetical protein